MTTKTIISFVGKSGVGKTTLIENLIPKLNGLGLKVAVVKHIGEDFKIDHPDKDSHRVFLSGADVSMVVSEQKVSLIKRLENPLSLKDISKSEGFFNSSVNGSDIIITEGFKRENEKKIELYREGFSESVLSDESEVLFFVSNSELLKERYNVFDFNEIDKIAAFIIMYMAIRDNAVFVGIGNAFKGDDGFGVEVIKRIKKYPMCTMYIDAGIAPENYISSIVRQKPETLVIFDAVFANQKVGDLKAYSAPMLMNTNLSTHGTGIKMFASYLIEAVGSKIFLIGVNPGKLGLSDEISHPVRKVIDEIAEFFERNYKPQVNTGKHRENRDE